MDRVPSRSGRHLEHHLSLPIAGGAAPPGRDLRRALAQDPADAAAWRSLGFSEHRIEALARAATGFPDDQDLLGAFASALIDHGGYAPARRLLRRLLAAAPGRADLQQLASHLAFCRRRPQAAMRRARRALAFDAGFAAARRSLHFAQLMAGDAAGFAALGPDFRPLPAVPLPLWRGESLAGKSLLVVGEEGFGDMIQMARFLTRPEARVTAVVPPPLLRLFSMLRGITATVEASPLGYDAWIPMMALPSALGVAAEVNGAPYLGAPGEGPLLPPSPLVGVGLCWRGRSTHAHDRRRSLTREMLTPLFDMPGFRFVGIDPGAVEPPVLDIPLQDFADTAFLMRQLDLVISVDTAVAHLAGALGVPTWIMLGDMPEWRWGAEGTRSRWYDSVRLYRSEGDDWSATVAAIARDLASLRRA